MAVDEKPPAQISPEARATRRRALGRRLIKNSRDLKISSIAIKDSPDLQFLTPTEEKALAKALKNLDSVAEYIDKLGSRLDAKAEK